MNELEKEVEQLKEDLRNWRGQMGDEFVWVAEYEQSKSAYHAQQTGKKQKKE